MIEVLNQKWTWWGEEQSYTFQVGFLAGLSRPGKCYKNVHALAYKMSFASTAYGDNENYTL